MENEEHNEEEWIERTTITADVGQNFLRIDRFLSDRLPNVSRTRIQAGIKSGNITVNQKSIKSNYKIKPGDVVDVVFARDTEPSELIPEKVDFTILYEDDDVLVLDKPAGLVVHPGQGNRSGTLVNGLLYHIEHLPQSKNGLDRPGIVHRLDKLTSGVMVVGKTEEALNHLAMQFFHRSIERRYLALVWGFPGESGTIEGHIGRSLKNRKRMQVFEDGSFGKTATTHYETLEDLHYVSLVRCKLETGRTHQIRVHFRFIGHPLFGDPEYDGQRIWKGTTFSKYKQFVSNSLEILPRQALHAHSLGFIHPSTGDRMHFESPVPSDMKAVLERWRNYRENKPEGN